MRSSVKPRIEHLKIFVLVSVVIIVVAELSPSFFSFPRDKRLDQATAMVCNEILLTRQKAIAGNTRYRIHFDVTSGDCRILREEAPGRWVPETPDKQREFPEGVLITPSGARPDGFIEIAANGAIENHGAPMVLQLTDPAGEQRSIRVSPSGMVQELPNL